MAHTEYGYLTPENLALFTDLYELTMMQGYYNQNHNPTATFDLFFRDLPPNRGYMVAAGLEQAIHYIETLSFGERVIEYLTEHGFDEEFLSHLETLEFTGDVRALPEGTPVFSNEPLVEVTAPILQGQLLETIVINQIGYQSLIATKAARMRDMITQHGDEQSLVDFGSRRAHGSDAGIKAARAAYIGGFDGTSNVAAGEAFGIPIYGTMAHSWIQSFTSERAAFETFVDEYGEESILLIDTYDTVSGAKTARAVAEEKDIDIAGVRLDSGDLTALSKEVNEILAETDLFISSGIDEFKIRRFLTNGGVGSGFGPGTALVTSTDAPKVEGVYKLVAVEEDGDMQPSMKLSTGKVTYPGAKSVRRVERDGQYDRDILALRDEDCDGGEQLVSVIEDGELVYQFPDLPAIQERARRSVSKTPPAIRQLEDPERYDVQIGSGLDTQTTSLRRQLESQHS
ncbi:nicotinate phosphoribosyltransferase (plasmid) [Haloferax mediterranei ATCC 33500]|uniref:nicotinate phosphoribosyltransferase n=1 Tax=Haloferax mediterranei (strain ATCC 33500 / DSM 1411 / JCM 8866 / NBRC 14739 / NCIMB 2177 / R-4) TaxID=523841 RepID=I3R9R9_HALMT|nr:nicotinate phosphoribosyltransferase [Haloferax mediterranei]AFK20979.1 nicotinate phosphoribosyltransferase [Haloferax mediterranei ATCC 33500]AHZ24157.1 nicotinate phosphoribosyltransferase [Haloferax mediterranei ATCC 33500]EMA05234.1 nicotinate phosphoribosyltransferase [Haloferax mediterranei ATCC 33500]MDX5989962.1 nicotinate phosphoribosyltransferase [Haloferax mediterranei ATCC 33500]QCQ77149.1 nicotinate phosphoribosyltransferase [Haloferax mediterranei ATCC 33500]